MIAMNTANTDNSNALDKAKSVLRDAESQIQRLVGEAAVDADYESVGMLTEWARAVASIYQAPATTSDRSLVQASRFRELEKNRPSTAGRKRRSTRPPGYPSFSKEGNSLVKTSWSKSRKDEYHHKSGRVVVDQLVEKLLAIGADYEIVTADDLFPLFDGEKEIPHYKSYSCLNWLKTVGVVKHLGREGYQIVDPDQIKAKVEQHWNELPEFEGQ